jgi:hypothetical protein
MPNGSVKAIIPASSAEVFQLIHDYSRRLEWDTLLQAADLNDGWPTAQLHATSICQGHSRFFRIALKTEYITFHPPSVAAVRLINHPPFFETFAATIRHRDLTESSSEIEYLYHFTARPRVLRWMLHPIMSRMFRHETEKRMQALAAFFVKEKSVAENSTLLSADSQPFLPVGP